MQDTQPEDCAAALLSLYEAFQNCQHMIRRSGLDPIECEICCSRFLEAGIARILNGKAPGDPTAWLITCFRNELGSIRRRAERRGRVVMSCEGLIHEALDPGPPIGLDEMWARLESRSAEIERILSPGETRILWAAKGAASVKEAAARACVSPYHFLAAYRRVLRKLSSSFLENLVSGVPPRG